MGYANVTRVNIADVPLNSLDLLGREAMLLGDYTAHACCSLSQDPCTVLNHCLAQLQLQVISHFKKTMCNTNSE